MLLNLANFYKPYHHIIQGNDNFIMKTFRYVQNNNNMMMLYLKYKLKLSVNNGKMDFSLTFPNTFPLCNILTQVTL